MGNQKQKWTAEEEAALKDGVTKHGIGKWKTILTDPDFAPALSIRSNIDLKDKWRNLGISNGVPASKDKTPLLAITCGSVPTAQNTNTTLSLVATNGTSNTHRTPQDGAVMLTKRMIFEAISSIKDSRGSDINAIASFIEQRHEVPHNFKRSLSSMVRRLTAQGKLEKVEQRFKIKNSGSSTRIPAPKVRVAKPQTCKNLELLNQEALEAAADTAAYRVADADSKAFGAAEAMKEAERVSAMANESEIMLEVVKGICKQLNL